MDIARPIDEVKGVILGKVNFSIEQGRVAGIDLQTLAIVGIDRFKVLIPRATITAKAQAALDTERYEYEQEKRMPGHIFFEYIFLHKYASHQQLLSNLSTKR